MSIESATLLPLAMAALDGLIGDIRSSPDREEPGTLMRVGQLDTRLAAARLAASAGKAEAAALLANQVLRSIARDFPGEAASGLRAADEDRLRRTIATRLLGGEAA